MWNGRDACRVLVGKSEEKRLLGRTKRKAEDYVKKWILNTSIRRVWTGLFSLFK
jgi:hypothetical protein